jgi:hypothetical protein
MSRRTVPPKRSTHLLVRRLTHALVWVVLAIFVCTSVGVLWTLH